MTAKMEIDSFILKFKRLLLSGRNATLVIQFNAGKAEINLKVELEDVSHHPHHEHHLRRWPRNGSSRERRRLRRAADAQEAEQSAENEEPVEEEVVAEKVVAEVAIDLEKDSANSATNEIEALKDEFCSNESFETTDDEQLVEKILVTADCQADWNKCVKNFHWWRWGAERRV